MKAPHRRADGKVRCALLDRWIRWHERDYLLRSAEHHCAEDPSRSNVRSVEYWRRERDRLKPPPPYETWAALEADLRATGQVS